MKIIWNKHRNKLQLYTSGHHEVACVSFEKHAPAFLVVLPGAFPEEQQLSVSVHLGLRFTTNIPCKAFARHHTEPGENAPMFGFTFFDSLLLLYWYRSHRSFKLPWYWRSLGDVRVESDSAYPNAVYHRPIEEGSSQRCFVKVLVLERREWRPWLMWKRTVRLMQVVFCNEMGESEDEWWKTGLLPTSTPLRPDISVELALRQEHPHLELGPAKA